MLLSKIDPNIITNVSASGSILVIIPFNVVHDVYLILAFVIVFFCVRVYRTYTDI